MSPKSPHNTDPTMSAIRAILHDDDAFEAEQPLPTKGKAALAASLSAASEKAGQVKQAAVSVKARARAVNERKGRDDIKPQEATSEKVIERKFPSIGFKPKRKHIYIAAFLLLALLRPWWILLGTVLLLLVLLGGVAILGADRIWGLGMRLFKWIARRSPERTTQLAKRMDRVAMRWDGFLDRFPEGMVDGLYFPDFQSLQQADARHEAAVDARLDRMQAGG